MILALSPCSELARSKFRMTLYLYITYWPRVMMKIRSFNDTCQLPVVVQCKYQVIQYSYKTCLDTYNNNGLSSLSEVAPVRGSIVEHSFLEKSITCSKVTIGIIALHTELLYSTYKVHNCIIKFVAGIGKWLLNFTTIMLEQRLCMTCFMDLLTLSMCMWIAVWMHVATSRIQLLHSFHSQQVSSGWVHEMGNTEEWTCLCTGSVPMFIIIMLLLVFPFCIQLTVTVKYFLNTAPSHSDFISLLSSSEVNSTTCSNLMECVLYS